MHVLQDFCVGVVDSSKVDETLLKTCGAVAVLNVQNGVQAVFEHKAIITKNAINGNFK